MQNYKYCPMCAGKLKWDMIEGRERFVCPECNWIDYRNPIPVVQCIVANKKGEILLIKRGVEPYKGYWSLPGGFVEVDETVEQAGQRELSEETGLDGTPGRLLGVYLQKSRVYGYVLVIGTEFLVECEDIAAGDDAEEARFFPRENLPKIPFKSHLDLIAGFFK